MSSTAESRAKPITEIRDILKDIKRDMNTMQNDISHIKVKIEALIKIKEEKEIAQIVEEQKGWWFG